MDKKQEMKDKLANSLIKLYLAGYPILEAIQIFENNIGKNIHNRQDFH